MASHSLLQRRFAPRKAVRLPSLYLVLFYNAIPDRIFPSFKNDGRGELRFDVVLNDFLAKKNRIGNVSCPRLSGKVSAELTKGVRVSKHVKRFLTKRY